MGANLQFFGGQIIAILAAILFPVFARAREKARQTSCLSNLKQLGLALHMYAQDYDEIFPRAAGYSAPVDIINNAGEWFISCAPYIKNNQVFNCPSALHTVFYSGGTSSNALGYGVAYGRNQSFGADYRVSGIPMARVPEPAATPYLMDGTNNYARAMCPATTTTCSYTGNYAWSWNRHNDGCNYNFADGHAKWIKVDPSGTNRPCGPNMHFCLTYHP